MVGGDRAAISGLRVWDNMAAPSDGMLHDVSPESGGVLHSVEVLPVAHQQLVDGHGGLLVEQRRLFVVH